MLQWELLLGVSGVLRFEIVPGMHYSLTSIEIDIVCVLQYAQLYLPKIYKY